MRNLINLMNEQQQRMDAIFDKAAKRKRTHTHSNQHSSEYTIANSQTPATVPSNASTMPSTNSSFLTSSNGTRKFRGVSNTGTNTAETGTKSTLQLNARASSNLEVPRQQSTPQSLRQTSAKLAPITPYMGPTVPDIKESDEEKIDNSYQNVVDNLTPTEDRKHMEILIETENGPIVEEEDDVHIVLSEDLGSIDEEEEEFEDPNDELNKEFDMIEEMEEEEEEEEDGMVMLDGYTSYTSPKNKDHEQQSPSMSPHNLAIPTDNLDNKLGDKVKVKSHSASTDDEELEEKNDNDSNDDIPTTDIPVISISDAAAYDLHSNSKDPRAHNMRVTNREEFDQLPVEFLS